MGAMDGVTMARKLRQDNQTVQIIFITGYADYISDGYEVDALHYLMKPIQEEKLFAVLDRAVTKLIKNEKVLNIISQGEMIRLPICQINYGKQQLYYDSQSTDYHPENDLKRVGKKAGFSFFQSGTFCFGKSGKNQPGHQKRDLFTGLKYNPPSTRCL